MKNHHKQASHTQTIAHWLWVVLVAFLAMATVSAYAQPSYIEGRVVRVSDGDTITVLDATWPQPRPMESVAGVC